MSLPLLPSTIALGLALSPGVSVAQPPVATSAAGAPVSECERLYMDGEYLAAARACEAEQALYVAGMARLAAGHDALAIARWEAYLRAGEVDPNRRADVEQRIASARVRTIPVRLEADPVPEPRTVELRREGRTEDAIAAAWPGGQARIEVPLDEGVWTVEMAGEPYGPVSQSVTVSGGAPVRVQLATQLRTTPVRVRFGPERALRRGVEVTWSGPRMGPPAQRLQVAERVWELPRGTWRVRAQARGFVSQEQEVVLEGPQAAPLVVNLARDRREVARVGVSAGLGVAAIALLGAGLGVTAVSARDVKAQMTPEATGQTVGNLYDCLWDNYDEHTIDANCRRADKATGHLALGLGMLGAAVGSVIPVAIAAKGLSRDKVKVEAAVGGSLTGLTLAWALLEVTLCMRTGDYGTTLPRYALAAGALGASTMVLSGALTHLIADWVAEARGRPRARRLARRVVVNPLGGEAVRP